MAAFQAAGGLPQMAPPVAVPPTGIVMSGPVEPDRFILNAGIPFSGKTTAALSFPNPLVLNLDRKIPREGVPSVPFHDDAFVESVIKRVNPMHPVNRRDAFTLWLQANMARLKPYTIIVDSITALETAFHQQTLDVEGKWGINGGLYFGAKLNYFLSICAMLQATGGRVIVNCHLAPIFVRDEKTGADVATGKNKPAMTGSGAERITSFCTSIVYSYLKTDIAKPGVLRYFWVLRPGPSFDARTLAQHVPPSGEIDVTDGAYEAFKKVF